MANYLPFIILAASNKKRNQQLATSILPAMMPDIGGRVALAAITARQEQDAAEAKEVAIVNETVAARQAVAAKGAAATVQDIAPFPRVAEIVARQPALKKVLGIR